MYPQPVNSQHFPRWIWLTTAFGTLFANALLLQGCATRPKNLDDVCSIFHQKHAWYRATRATEQRWGIDQATQMAVIFQESSFRAGARPPRTKLLGFIPWRRKSSAYGYAQVVNGTWNIYRRQAAKPLARRDRFADAASFIGWFMDRIAARTQIGKASAGNLYLAYHEGAGGYQRGTHLKKLWLLDAASRVEKRTTQYRAQLDRCRDRLERHRWWWPI
jgi:hypothetical protein